MGLTGDFPALQDLVESLQELAGSNFRRQLQPLLAEVARSLVAQEFEGSRDPYGRPWAPLKRRKGQPLLDTGRLRNSFGVDSFSDNSFRFGTDVVYAGVHQDGATFTQAARVNAHKRGGQFLSRKAAGSESRKKLKVSFSPEHQVEVPQRQILPEGDLPDAWADEFGEVAEQLLGDLFSL